jgi:hypothetical protein
MLCCAFNRRIAPIMFITSCSSFSNSMSLHCSHYKTQCHVSVKNSKLHSCQRICLCFVTSDVLTGVLPKMQIFWGVTICWLTNDNWCFEGLCCHYVMLQNVGNYVPSGTMLILEDCNLQTVSNFCI